MAELISTNTEENVMHELLMGEATLKRRPEAFADLTDITIVTLNQSGELKRNGEAVELTDLNISMVRLDGELLETDQSLVVQLLMSAPEFKFVQTMAAGLDNPLFETLVDKSEVFCNSDAQAPAIAEFSVASVLNHWHQFDQRQLLQTEHQWEEVSFKQLLDSHWLIVGFGHIGERVARQVKSAGACVTGIRRNPAPHQDADVMARPEDLPELLPSADVVLLSCALNEQTRGLADVEFFEEMSSDAVLVNIGRGELIDEAALINALDERQLDYAILDVFKTEPLPTDSAFWDHPYVQVTAHASHAGNRTKIRFDELFDQNLRHYLNGEPVRNQVTSSFFHPG